jgi:hypothetical protein
VLLRGLKDVTVAQDALNGGEAICGQAVLERDDYMMSPGTRKRVEDVQSLNFLIAEGSAKHNVVLLPEWPAADTACSSSEVEDNRQYLAFACVESEVVDTAGRGDEEKGSPQPDPPTDAGSPF